MGSLQVQFTIDDRALGERITTDLLRDRLVACAQTLGPVTSRYWWNGSVEQAEEWMFVCKTTSARVDEVIERIRERHPYEIPEIVASEISTAYAPYADWIAAETQAPPNTARS
jgi:periplasmic divalent cation tolerance protein